MNKIRVLNDNMINLVSAGEVIERPASVVKELVENSIDAGSSSVSIEIKNGGKKLIRVIDNGSGISRNDIRLAFINHATSKISKESDLDEILTLGFRGEALPSISSISKVDLTSYFDGEQFGSHYRIEGGQEIFLKDSPQCKGSSISIWDLFYNTPVRMKFLKKDSTESGYIKTMVDHIILSHPEISFKFIKDGKLIVSSIGDGKLDSVVIRVFGREFFGNLLNVNYESSEIHIKGFISKPSTSNLGSKIRSVFINGRWIKDKIISDSVEIALNKECQFPKVSYILYIKINPHLIDVNVHPTKSEVRFQNEKLIFESVYNAIRECILNYRENLFKLTKIQIPKIEKEKKIEYDILCDVSAIPSSTVFNHKSDYQINSNIKNNIKNSEQKPKIDTSSAMNNYKFDINKTLKFKYENSSFINDELKIIGEIFECFLIVQYDNEVILVDKHAAHERIIFEKLNSQSYNSDSQVLFSSVTVNLSQKDYDIILSNIELISKIGYKIEDFGFGKLIVREIPIYLNKSDIVNSLCEIADFISKSKSCVELDELKSVYAKIACKSAIKAGTNSSISEIKSLIKKLIELKITNCPHGRPIYLSFNKNDIYKKFLRNI